MGGVCFLAILDKGTAAKQVDEMFRGNDAQIDCKQGCMIGLWHVVTLDPCLFSHKRLPASKPNSKVPRTPNAAAGCAVCHLGRWQNIPQSEPIQRGLQFADKATA